MTRLLPVSDNKHTHTAAVCATRRYLFLSLVTRSHFPFLRLGFMKNSCSGLADEESEAQHSSREELIQNPSMKFELFPKQQQQRELAS